LFALSGAAALILVMSSANHGIARRMALVSVGAGLLAILAGPTAFSIATVGRAYAGGDPSAGPAVTNGAAFSGGPGPRFDGGNFPPPNGGAFPAGGAFGAPGGGFAPYGAAPGGSGPGPGGQVDSALIKYLEAHQGNATWIVAVNGANQAGSIELATGKPVMAMGGFSGTDPTPTVQQLQVLVKAGKLRYILIGGGGFGGPAGNNSQAQQISSWVQANGRVVDYGSSGGLALYDLSGAVS
jgi:hypothetical protein